MVGQFAILGYIKANPGVSVSKIQKRFKINMSSVNRMTKQLVKYGLVTQTIGKRKAKKLTAVNGR